MPVNLINPSSRGKTPRHAMGWASVWPAWMAAVSIAGPWAWFLASRDCAAAPGPGAPAPATAVVQTPGALSAPFELRDNGAVAFDRLLIRFSQFDLSAGQGVYVPIETRWGVTGMVLLAPVKFRYAHRNRITVLEGESHATVLRFSPQDYDRIVPLTLRSGHQDVGAAELARLLVGRTLARCYSDGAQVIALPKGVMAATFYARDRGDVFVLDNGQAGAAYAFTQRKFLFGESLNLFQP